jgi:hypothetical protein
VRNGLRRGAAIGVVLFALTRPAHADQPSAVDRDAARALVQQGDELIEKGDYPGALEAYRHADEIMGVPTTAIEVGKTYLLLGRLVEAAGAFQRAATYPEAADEPKPFARARRESARRAADLDARIPRLTILVAGVPANQSVTVTLDGKTLASRSGLRVDPGPHEVAASAAGYDDARVVFELADRDRRTVDVTMEPAGASLWPLAIAGLTVAGVGGVLGAVTGGLSLDAASQVDDLCTDDQPRVCQPEAAGIEDRRVALGHTSTVSLAIGGVGLVVGLVGLVLSLEDQPAAAWIRGRDFVVRF